MNIALVAFSMGDNLIMEILDFIHVPLPYKSILHGDGSSEIENKWNTIKDRANELVNGLQMNLMNYIQMN